MVKGRAAFYDSATNTPLSFFKDWRPSTIAKTKTSGIILAATAAALDALIAGQSFATMCERLLEWHTEDAAALRAPPACCGSGSSRACSQPP